MTQQIIIIGAGAAGCFAAIELKRICPDVKVTLIEKGRRPLAKVAITGGGRCNLTNSFLGVKSMEQIYPRGFRLMKKLFHEFSHSDTCRWFESKGIRLVTQEDQCVFPQSQDAMEIVNCLLWQLRKKGVEILTETSAELIIPVSDGYVIQTNRGEMSAQKVLVAVGGQPHASGYDFLKQLELNIIPSLPSLFSFCLGDESIKTLMGTVVQSAVVTLPGTKLKAEGPLLITHWGISGPVVLKLSSYAARVLAERDYVTDVCIHWLIDGQEDLMLMLRTMADVHCDKKVTSIYPEAFNARLWQHLLNRSSISPNMRWKDLKERDLNRLLNTLTNDIYALTGKNRFKDEFVTCGGVSLSSFHPSTLEAKKYRGLFFAGEITDVDAVTGGFNLQAAWTMGYVAAHGMCATVSF